MSAARDGSPSSSSPRRRSSESATRHDSAASEATTVAPANDSAPTNNIWDSAWATINQVPPPGLTDVLGAYAQKGENDREMLLRILQAKSAEDERIASVASLQRTILELQSAAIQQGARALATAGYATPSTTPPSHSPPLPHQHAAQHHAHHSHHRHHSRHPSITASYGPGGSPPTRHEAYPNAASSSASSSSYPTLPPIASMGPMTYGEPPRKRARAAASPPPPQTRSGVSRRGSPEYPLSPYSMDSSSNTRNTRQSPPRRSNGYADAPTLSSSSSQQWSAPNAAPVYANGHGRVSVNSLLGAGSEDDGDVRYRRMSAERSSR
ncbi:hypothetical protein FRB96_004850 [Tulasnella sp. 330]|nr:hypothetical protein FRB96_004850 [Tulasnella sp. 330]KAG8885460.1 hypothetical protein FRB97_001183 [Tulasnella sp. 331]KAG8890092.1 hypothetical protein FRB98_001205 [Tulasnella sp. 332]